MHGLRHLLSRLRHVPAPFRPLINREALVRDMLEHDPEYARVRKTYEDAQQIAHAVRPPVQDWDEVRRAEIEFRRRRRQEGYADGLADAP